MGFMGYKNRLGRLGLGVLLVWVMVLGTGCQVNTSSASTDACDFMEQIALDTEKCIQTKNTTLARDVWSKITEYSILAKQEEEKNDFSKAISSVAATYESLVGYCESGDEQKLDKFLTDFQKEAGHLATVLKEAGFEVTQLEDRIDEIVSL